MRTKTHRLIHRIEYAAIFNLLAGILLSIWILYGCALPGYALFDDWPSLDGLKSAPDWPALLNAILSGNTGPLGRPLALATFAVQRDLWPDDTASFLRVNFATHLLATLCCYALAAGLARIRSPDPTTAPLWVALGVAAIWGLSPFLATTHLMIIQRMSSLAGLFVFAGLAAFVWAHLIEPRNPWIRPLLMGLGLGLGTLLATLSKETGALLPLLALVILWLWIPKERRLRGRAERILILALAVIPSLLLLAYLAQRFPEVLSHGYGPYRYFTPGERMMGQPTVLLDYLRNLLFPSAAAVTPFMDRVPVPHGWLDPPITLVAALFWPALLSIAIRFQKSAPYLLFGLTFFLVGHLLESTFIGLEIYFAHRNYTPSFGIYFLLIYAATKTPIRYRTAAISGLAAYVILFAAILFQATATWNDMHVNAELWIKENPNTERGVQFLSNQYIKQGDPARARAVLDDAAARDPRLAMIQIQRTNNCVGREQEFPKLLLEVTDALSSAYFQPLAAHELAKSARHGWHPLCSKRDYAALDKMVDALLENPTYAKRENTKAFLFLAKAFIRAETDEIPDAIEFFIQTFKIKPELDVLFLGTSLLANSGKYSKAYDLLREARETAPSSGLKRKLWIQRLDDYFEIMKKSEEIDMASTKQRNMTPTPVDAL